MNNAHEGQKRNMCGPYTGGRTSVHLPLCPSWNPSRFIPLLVLVFKRRVPSPPSRSQPTYSFSLMLCPSLGALRHLWLRSLARTRALGKKASKAISTFVPARVGEQSSSRECICVTTLHPFQWPQSSGSLFLERTTTSMSALVGLHCIPLPVLTLDLLLCVGHHDSVRW